MKKFIAGIVLSLLVFMASASSVSANHSWGGYHWARQTPSFSLKLGDNVSSEWDSILATTSSDWSQSNVLDTTIVGGQGGKNCRPTSGRVEVCNRKYGNNGWLGIAQIWITGGDHIAQGTTKLNDTYFGTAKYNTVAWRNLVSCQEVGHTFGLDHQDENFNNANLNTCMDYTSNPESNQHPNAHDYEELGIIYAHTDSFTSVDMTTAQIASRLGQLASSQSLDDPREWGRLVSQNGGIATFERDLGFGNKIVTHIIWAE